MSREERQSVAEELLRTLQAAFQAWHRAVGRVEGVAEQIRNSLGCTEDEGDGMDGASSPLLSSLTYRRHNYCAAVTTLLPKVEDALSTLQSLLADESHNYKTFLLRTKNKGFVDHACVSGGGADEPVDINERLAVTPPSRLSRVTLLQRCVDSLQSLVGEYEILLHLLETPSFSKDQDDLRKDQLKDLSGSESQIIFDLKEYTQNLSKNDNNASRGTSATLSVNSSQHL